MRQETDGGFNNATRYRRSCSDTKKSPLPYITQFIPYSVWLITGTNPLKLKNSRSPAAVVQGGLMNLQSGALPSIIGVEKHDWEVRGVRT